MTDKQHGTIAIVAALFVLATALLAPAASIFLAVIALVALGIVSLKKPPTAG